ncbi:hypothetical protein EON68_02100 [archaeon]|nr:MAG: hypothetical protein EON68_02100 [archaeon]
MHARDRCCRREGVFVGPSAALNVVGAVKAARALGPGHTIVTVLCDGGEKYFKTLYNVEAMLASGHRAALDVDTSRDHADFVQ